MGPRLILVTRPKEQAREFAAEIERLGATPIICPLLDVHSVSCDLLRFSGLDAVIVTSQQVFFAGVDYSRFFLVPVYCVGEKTGEAARRAGFSDVRAADGDIESLVFQVKKDMPSSSRILYVRGEDVRADLSSLLTGFQINEAVVYKAEAVPALPQDVIDLFPKLDAICLFSPRSGSILRELMDKHALTACAGVINLLSLSRAVLESVGDLGWKTSRVADRPDVRSMISELTSILGQAR